jgi:DNA-binding XRE family transcriptional regulator
MESLGDKIIAYRKKNGLTQKMLAQILNVNKSTIKDWEKNKHKPSKKLLKRILNLDP